MNTKKQLVVNKQMYSYAGEHYNTSRRVHIYQSICIRIFVNHTPKLLGLGKRDDASRRHPYRASSPSRAGHVTVAHSMTNPIDGNWYENECVSTGCLSFDINM